MPAAKRENRRNFILVSLSRSDFRWNNVGFKNVNTTEDSSLVPAESYSSRKFIFTCRAAVQTIADLCQ